MHDEYFRLGENRETRWAHAPGQLELLDSAKAKARQAGLWNFFLPDSEVGGLSNLDYAYIAVELGKYPLGSESLNCSAPDTGRSEEHTSELQSLMRISYAVFCLKKKNIY